MQEPRRFGIVVLEICSLGILEPPSLPDAEIAEISSEWRIIT
jgi:hypothetical protein